jgi:cysteine desulfurase/selenocysteine lyase
MPPGQVKELLSAHRVNVSVSRTPSTRLDMEARGLDELVRASVHYYNTCDELDVLCRIVRERNQ